MLVKCMAGCSTPAVLDALGLTTADLFSPSNASRSPAQAGIHRWRVNAVRPLRRIAQPKIDLLPHAKRWHSAADLTPLADLLGVTTESLVAMRTGWASATELRALRTGYTGRGCWTFPMRDDVGRLVGIRLRSEPDAIGRCRKYAVSGSRQGLFVPAGLQHSPPLLCVAEGATDTIALHTLGLPAVGVPSKGQGGDALVLLLQRVGPGRVLLLPDADDIDDHGMANIARRLAEHGIASHLAHPPGGAKDVRAYLNAGGDASGIRQLLDGPAESVVRQ